LWQLAAGKNFVSVRYPFVVGETDYTGRLLSYVQHVVKQIPMFVDNLDHRMGFINEREAGEFMAHLAASDFVGAINGCSRGTVTLRQIIEYIEKKTGIHALLCEDGDPAPYNGEVEYSINTERAESEGYFFSHVEDWIWNLVDRLIEKIEEENHASKSVR
jgi:nucleoside-diphosphate-sugar epimerase